ncbi:hypothetical protein NESM_000160900 [Novymonas esmeraldas]|uniref:Uncharacterized protein n=1 Tax=Novymonas esmeraldas TaxID=1808958 RepID=A0AAW0F719_9TRYP
MSTSAAAPHSSAVAVAATVPLGGEGDASAALSTMALHDALARLCESYAESYLLQRHPPAPPTALQPRQSVNVHHTSSSGTAAATKCTGTTFASSTSRLCLAAPPELVREYTQMKEAVLLPSPTGCTVPQVETRSAEVLEVENAYLRALVARLAQSHPSSPQHRSPSFDPQPTDGASPLLSPRPELHIPTHDPRRSPSAACPESNTRERAAAAAGDDGGLVDHRGSRETSPAPATAHQVSDLQEQIVLLREAVQGLSRQTSVVRRNSVSPAPADAVAPPLRLRAISPSPRCATPTCTTDVPTLQRIILHQQQTIRTLQQEMEDVHAAKSRMERAMAQLREATSVIATHEEVGGEDDDDDEDDDAGLLGATTHWRSTCQTEDSASGIAPPAVPILHDYAEQDATEPAFRNGGGSGGAAAAARDERAAVAREILQMDAEAVADVAPARRRAATFGGLRPPLWFDSNTSSADPLRPLGTGTTTVEEEEEEEVEEDPSSGMRTPLPRRTVVLHPRFSSATGETSSIGGGAGVEESPFPRHTHMSCGTGSNRRTTATAPFTTL